MVKVLVRKRKENGEIVREEKEKKKKTWEKNRKRKLTLKKAKLAGTDRIPNGCMGMED